jgi:hypothetical protein
MWVPNPRIFRAIFLVSVVVVFVVSAQAVVYTNAYVNGSYSFLLNTWTADTTAGQDAVLGVMHFDGAGKVTGSFSDMNRGALTTGTATGTYSVNANGTGTITLTATPGGTQQFAMVLNTTKAKVANSLHLLITNDTDNAIESGTAILQTTAAATYTAASLKGILAFQLNEWTADVNQNRVGTVGRLSFNGAGQLTASFTQMKAGVLQTGTCTGTYTVNSDGSGALSLVCGTDTPQLAVVLNTVAVNATTKLGLAKSLQLLVTNENGNNRVTSGIALKQ